MPQALASVIENNFSKALITEASALTFPQNACLATKNCVHSRTGPVLRRLGIDFEPTFQTKEADREDGVVVSYLWKNVAGQADFNLAVIQIGNILHFYDASTTDPLSNHPVTYTYDLTDQMVSGAAHEPRLAECQFDDGNGQLFVVNPFTWPFRLVWDPDTMTGTVTRLNIKIRDFEGLEDILEDDERPSGGLSSLSTAHEYNLRNQGWTTDSLEMWDTQRTDMPSNVDVVWQFKSVDPSTGKDTLEFDDDTVLNKFAGNSPAPKGHFILDLFNQARSEVSDVLGIADVVITEKPTAVAFFSGRIFYAGIQNEEANSQIFFSQVVENDEQYEKCYQVNDPTAEDLFDLLPTDGGVIKVQEIGNIVKLVSVGPGLLVFATNGVWMIVGSTGIGFTANDYSVTKISNIPTISSSSFVEISGTIMWWNLEGIYLLSQSGPAAAAPQVQSLTEETIKTYYNTITPAAKRRAQGSFNPNTGVVQWLYREAESGNPTELYEGTHILNLDVVSKGFYGWELPTDEDAPKLHTIIVLENISGLPVEELVTENGVTVTEDGEDVYIFNISNFINTPKFKYVTSRVNDTDDGYLFTFSEAWDENHKDFASYVEYDFDSYFVSGAKILGELSRRFQTPYVTVLSKGPDPVSYKFQGQWSFGNTGNSGKWSNEQLIEIDDAEFDYIRRRHKVRGFGTAIQFKVSSISGAQFNIAGWSIVTAVNQRP